MPRVNVSWQSTPRSWRAVSPSAGCAMLLAFPSAALQQYRGTRADSDSTQVACHGTRIPNQHKADQTDQEGSF